MLTYQLNLGYDSIHNITSKDQSDVITQPSGTPVAQKKTSYLFNYAYNASGTNSVRPHAPTHIGNLTYSYDANGNQLGWSHDDNGTRRNIVGQYSIGADSARRASGGLGLLVAR